MATLLLDALPVHDGVVLIVVCRPTSKRGDRFRSSSEVRCTKPACCNLSQPSQRGNSRSGEDASRLLHTAIAACELAAARLGWTFWWTATVSMPAWRSYQTSASIGSMACGSTPHTRRLTVSAKPPRTTASPTIRRLILWRGAEGKTAGHTHLTSRHRGMVA